VEQDGEQTPGISRGQNVVFVMPADWTRAASFLTPALERLNAAEPATQLLAITSDADAAVALAAAANALGGPLGLSALAATSARRTSRALRAHPAQVVVGDARTLVALLQNSTLKLAAVSQLVIAWLDDALDATEPVLEVLFAELPKEAARTIVTREATPEIEALIERYARRARRVLPPAAEAAAGLPVQYLAVHDALRPTALQRLLDELDPVSAFVYARDPRAQAEAAGTLRTLGYAADGPMRVGATMDADADALVLYDLPATHAELHEIVGERAPRHVIALVQPRQLAALRDIAGGPTSPFVLPEAVQRARAQEDQLRDTLRDILASGAHTRELLALEPLLGEFDGVEIAAALLRMHETEKLAAATAVPASEQKMARLFINAGEADGFRAGDFVGAVTGHAGLSGRDVGRVEVRDRHSLVEVPEAVAAAVATRITGVTIKGRQLVARLDEERPERGPRGPRRPPQDRDGGSGPGARRPGGDRGDRGDRGGPRGGDRGAPRGGDRGGPRGGSRGAPPRGPRRPEGGDR